MSQNHPYEYPIRQPIEEAVIEFRWRDANGETKVVFESVHRLAEFLKYNNVFAQMVGYVPKKK